MADTPISVPAGWLELTNDSTKLLLSMDGTDGSTTFTDATGKTVTANGNAQIDTAQSVFGGASAYFDGTGDYLSLSDSADWDFGSGDFELDLRARFDLLPTAGNVFTIASQWGSTSRAWALLLWNDTGTYKFQFAYSTNGTNVTSVFNTWPSPAADTWYRIKLLRQSGNLSVFVDSTQVGTTQAAAATFSNSTRALQIGLTTDGPYPTNGWYDNFRLRKGFGNVTSGYTVATAPFAYTAPTVNVVNPTFITPGAGAITSNGKIPAVSITQQVNPLVGGVAVYGYVPAAGTSYNLSVPVGGYAATGQALSLVIGVLSRPSGGSMNIAGQAGTAPIAWSMPSGTQTISGQVPALYIGQYLPVGAGTTSFAGQSFGHKTGFAMTTVSITLTGHAPVDAQGVRIAAVEAGGLILTGQSPSIPLLSSPSYNVVSIEALF